MFFFCMNQAISDARYRVRVDVFDFELGCDNVSSGAKYLYSVVPTMLLGLIASSYWFKIKMTEYLIFNEKNSFLLFYLCWILYFNL